MLFCRPDALASHPSLKTDSLMTAVTASFTYVQLTLSLTAATILADAAVTPPSPK